MRLSVWFDDQKNAPTVEPFITTKVRSALRCHAHRLSSGELRVRHEQTTAGPVTRCSLDLKSFTNGTIHVDESGENEFVAISKALRAAALKLKRTAERRKDNGRRRGRTGKVESRNDLMTENASQFDEKKVAVSNDVEAESDTMCLE